MRGVGSISRFCRFGLQSTVVESLVGLSNQFIFIDGFLGFDRGFRSLQWFLIFFLLGGGNIIMKVRFLLNCVEYELGHIMPYTVLLGCAGRRCRCNRPTIGKNIS